MPRRCSAVAKCRVEESSVYRLHQKIPKQSARRYSASFTTSLRRNYRFWRTVLKKLQGRGVLCVQMTSANTRQSANRYSASFTTSLRRNYRFWKTVLKKLQGRGVLCVQMTSANTRQSANRYSASFTTFLRRNYRFWRTVLLKLQGREVLCVQMTSANTKTVSTQILRILDDLSPPYSWSTTSTAPRQSVCTNTRAIDRSVRPCAAAGASVDVWVAPRSRGD
ncbi:hypothetical protein J6590_043361 [Homalodisca vitripennis]|nr:hypothetical protein J6590_043361 [Homalodisca vitripennis]